MDFVDKAGLEWEVRWICNNRHRYDGGAHILGVIANIARRYRRNARIKQIRFLRPKILKVLNVPR